ncbi:MAG: hypothetical protein AMXMBFR25_26040 [Lysobacterales bacterium]|nr:hypothetical protein [Xanthomonadales bacterium]
MSLPTARPPLLLAALLAALIPAAHAGEFVYQGQLDDRGVPANGRFDLRIAAFGGEQSPQTLLAPIEFPAVEVKDGHFELRFDAPLASDSEAWLEVAVRDAGAAAYTTIPGRSKAIAAPLIGACWSTTGDTGSSPATNFLGTTDAQPFVIRTRNAQSLRLEPSSVLSGGLPITANVIGGSLANSVAAGVRGATIAGGGAPLNSDPTYPNEAPNSVNENYGTVGGGYGNEAGQLATVGGGYVNTAYQFSTIGGGDHNVTTGTDGTVAGGTGNVAGAEATVAGGKNNAAGPHGAIGGGVGNKTFGSATHATVGGGFNNAAVGYYSTVSGGKDNCAGGAYSWAGGFAAKVRSFSDTGLAGCSGYSTGGVSQDSGTFVWADSQGSAFVSTGQNQFLVRANGGAMFNTNALVGVNDDLVIAARPGASGGDADADLRLVSRNGRSVVAYANDVNGTLHITPANLTSGSDRLIFGGGSGGAATLSNGGTWTNASSRTFKEGFAAIDPLEVLDRVLALGISRWSYIGSGEGEHVGPMAEDFHAAFGLGNNEQRIATVDADGVALAAIQGLNAKLEAENAALREEMAALRALVESRLQGER